MGEAKRRKHLKAVPRPRPIECRELTLFVPKDLADRLDKLCPPEHPLREWLVGALGAFANWAEQEKQKQERASSLILPAAVMPPPGALPGYFGSRRPPKPVRP